ncbi:hypothetical protein QSV35_04535 [Microbacterium sp. ASV49]|uniref:Uncharacterized protein n=1 Tax=Microbacterium candidum TaxID=3041922 RepID=A0ABT7MVW1_9MICO|nr:hypothetical protein [Microbacterium sp. ASV49]
MVDSANADAGEKLAYYKRDALIEALDPFRRPRERDGQASPELFGRLFRRAVRYRYSPCRRIPAASWATPQDLVHPMRELIGMGAGLFFIYWFMGSTELIEYLDSMAGAELTEERGWLEDRGPFPSGAYAGHIDLPYQTGTG